MTYSYKDDYVITSYDNNCNICGNVLRYLRIFPTNVSVHKYCASIVLTKCWLFFWIVLGEFKEQLLCKESTRTNIQTLCDIVKCLKEIEESRIHILEDEVFRYNVIIWPLRNKCYFSGRTWSVWEKEVLYFLP